MRLPNNPVPASEVELNGPYRGSYIRRHIPTEREQVVERGFLGPRHLDAAIARWNRQQPGRWHYRRDATHENHLPRH